MTRKPEKERPLYRKFKMAGPAHSETTFEDKFICVENFANVGDSREEINQMNSLWHATL